MVSKEIPLPQILPWNEHFFRALARGCFELQHCLRCGRWIYFPRVVCPYCLQEDMISWDQPSGLGIVFSYALIHRPQHEAFSERVPIPLIAVQLYEGPTVISEFLGDVHELRIGLKVRAQPVPATSDIGLLKFRLAREPGGAETDLSSRRQVIRRGG